MRSSEKARTSTTAFADRVATAAMAAYHSSESSTSSTSGQICLSSILSHDNLTDELTVLSFGVGNKFLDDDPPPDSPDSTSSSNTAVRDMHAEILAVRSFRKFLLSQMLTPATPPFLSVGGRLGGVSFSSPGKFELPPSLTLHLYSSSAPCGDSVVRHWAKGGTLPYSPPTATASPWPPPEHPKTFASAIDKGQFALLHKGGARANDPPADPTNRVPPPPGTAYATPDSNPTRIHTCSDKILLYNYLGIQGSLLAELLETPLFLTSIIVGRKHSDRHVERAVCCRGTYKPKSQRAHNPPVRHISCMGTSVILDSSTLQTSALATATAAAAGAVFSAACTGAWLAAHGEFEIDELNGLTGYLNDGQASRISTSHLFSDYCTLKSVPCDLVDLPRLKKQAPTAALKRHLMETHGLFKHWSWKLRDDSS